MISLTMNMAKANFFDPKAFEGPVDKATQKILNKFGSYCRKVAKNSIKTHAKSEHSSPGSIPFGHDGKTRYKDFIFYFFDKKAKEVVIGAVLLPRKDGTIVPGVLEHGGQVEKVVSGKNVIVNQEARPHMVEAFNKTIEKNLDELIKNSIVQG